MCITFGGRAKWWWCVAAEWDSYVVLWRSIKVSAASMEREMRVFSGQENANDVAWSYNAYKAGERELVDEVVRQRKMSVILQGLVRKREAFFRRSCASSPYT